MSIEACSFLRPSLKAKLQDSGVLFLDDLLQYFQHTDTQPAGERERSGEAPQSSSAHLPLHAQQTAEVFLLKCDDSLEEALRRRLPTLTKDELFDLMGSTTAYLASREKRFAARRSTSGQRPAPLGAAQHTYQSTVSSAEDPLVPQPPAQEGPVVGSVATAMPFFSIRSLGQIEREATAPSRERPANRRGPTHATTFCRSLDTLLGAPNQTVAVVSPHQLLSPSSSSSLQGKAVVRGGGGGTTTTTTATTTTMVKEGGKGVEVGKVTELSGPPGVGKTQMLLQLAVSCAMPVELGGLAGDCLFIDTEGSFVYDRFHEMALAAVALVKDGERRHRRLHERATTGNEREAIGKDGRRRSLSSPPPKKSRAAAPSTSLAQLAERFTLSSILSRVHYVRVADTASFMAVLYSIPTWMQQRNREDGANSAKGSSSNGNAVGEPFALKMVLVDSIAGPFRTVAVPGAGGGSGAPPTSSIGPGGNVSNSDGGGGRQGPPLELASLRQRNRLLFTCGERLQAYAAGFNLAIVVSNQVTSRTMRRGDPSGLARFLWRRRQGGRDGSKGGARAEGGDGDDSIDEDGSEEDFPSPSRSSKGRPAEMGGRGEDGEEDDLYTYLVPALGDAWATHASTRVLLSYHHYALPYFLSSTTTTTNNANSDEEDNVTGSTAVGNGPDNTKRTMLHRTMCPEDLVLCRGQAHGGQHQQQHRVARLIKHDCNARGECCFVISHKGIRDFTR